MQISQPAVARFPRPPLRSLVTPRRVMALIDQMLISGTSFFVTILTARSVSLREFGVFTLGCTLLWGLQSVQAGLLTQPHNILGANRRGRSYRSYTTATLLGQILLGCAIIVATSALSLLAWYRNWPVAAMLAILGPAIFCRQFQDLLRRICYTEARVGRALVIDGIAYGGLIVVVCVLWKEQQLTGVAVFGGMVLCSGLATLAGLWQLRRSFCSTWRWKFLRENWRYGKWLAGGNLVSHWLSSESFVLMAASLVNLAAAGILQAVDTVFGPARILSQALATLLPIRLARALANQGERGLRRELWQTSCVAVPVFGGYCLAVALFATPLMTLLYGRKYAGHSSILIYAALEAFCAYLTLLFDAALQARQNTKAVFHSRLLTACATLPLGLILILLAGVHGAVWGGIACQALLLAFLWGSFHRSSAADAVADQALAVNQCA